jgi:uncharacterized protein
MKMAIIGTGISGLGCAFFLHRRYDLTIYEQNDYAGGHTNTITVDEDMRPVPVDTGFMVFNPVTYPNLTRLFKELNVETKPTDMSFSVQHVPANLEYNGGSLNLLFAQRSNLLRPRFWKMLAKINRFNAEAVTALGDQKFARHTIREYIEERGYGNDMLNLYLVPMGSAVWSTSPDRMLDFPAMTLLRFWHNHGFLGLHTQHQWFTVNNGAVNYLKAISAPFYDRILLNKKVVKITRETGKVRITSADGSSQTFDKAILASHADQSLAMLADPTESESQLLKKFRYQPNTATLHTDPLFMPRTKRCWASWNYRIDSTPDGGILPTTHYWMNSLQGVSQHKNYFVSLNCHDRVAPEKVLRRIEYEHPLFDLAAIAAQKELPKLNSLSRDQTTYYAGAWFKYGFHEDGFTSALDCARAITGEPLWN